MADMSDMHNELVREFVTALMAKTLKGGGKSADLMVILESITLAVMLTNIKVFRMLPQDSAAMAEAALARAIERLTEQMK